MSQLVFQTCSPKPGCDVCRKPAEVELGFAGDFADNRRAVSLCPDCARVVAAEIRALVGDVA